MDTFVLDLTGVASLEDFHDRAAKVLDFPPYYGRNLDAFWDCITDFVGSTTVQIVGLPSADTDLGGEIDRYVQLLKDYESKTNGEFSVSATPSN